MVSASAEQALARTDLVLIVAYLPVHSCGTADAATASAGKGGCWTTALARREVQASIAGYGRGPDPIKPVSLPVWRPDLLGERLGHLEVLLQRREHGRGQLADFLVLPVLGLVAEQAHGLLVVLDHLAGVRPVELLARHLGQVRLLGLRLRAWLQRRRAVGTLRLDLVLLGEDRELLVRRGMVLDHVLGEPLDLGAGGLLLGRLAEVDLGHPVADCLGQELGVRPGERGRLLSPHARAGEGQEGEGDSGGSHDVVSPRGVGRAGLGTRYPIRPRGRRPATSGRPSHNAPWNAGFPWPIRSRPLWCGLRALRGDRHPNVLAAALLKRNAPGASHY